MHRVTRSRRAAFVAIAVITLYGALLRLDALVARYGTLDHPAWAAALTQDVAPLGSRLRPFDEEWSRIDHPYAGGDPINYLRFAREMQSFYQAHVREPVFLALTRAYLWCLGGQDVAVSFASATGSILIILATYLLAAMYVPRPAALAAALLVAIEYEFITWAPDGWRDDTFTATVVLTAWAFVRMAKTPTWGNAILLGTTAATACLTRITALSFILPAFVWLAIDRPGSPVRARLSRGALALLLAAALTAPFLVNCWIATGDPFHAINYHTVYYRAGEGLPADTPMSVTRYLSDKFARRPVATADTGFLGLFIEPFVSKWGGLHPALGRVAWALTWAAPFGLLLLAGTPLGRGLLVMLFTSLVPYAFTWNIAAGNMWRFTMHVYPLYLVASVYAVMSLWRIVSQVRTVPRAAWRPSRSALMWWGASTMVVLMVGAIYVGLPWLVVREAIAAGEDTNIHAGTRDRIFFGSGWSQAFNQGVTIRVSTGERSHIRIPLPARRGYELVLRLDPTAPGVQQRFTVLLNGQVVARFFYTAFDSSRVGSYRFPVRPEQVRTGSNKLTLIPETLVDAGSAGERYTWLAPETRVGVRLWYVRVLASVGTEARATGPMEAIQAAEAAIQSREATACERGQSPRLPRRCGAARRSARRAVAPPFTGWYFAAVPRMLPSFPATAHQSAALESSVASSRLSGIAGNTILRPRSRRY